MILILAVFNALFQKNVTFKFLAMQKLIFFFILIFPFICKSQKFEYQVIFDGIGDNREYFSGKSLPQTILGVRAAIETGFLKDNHRIRGGISQFYEFGSHPNLMKPLLTLYYQYSDKKKEFVFGSFPRKGKINFPLAMLTDTLQYYRPNMEGMFTEIKWDWGKQNGFVDWTSRQTDTKREQFMAGFSGEIAYKNLFAENFILMFHNAGPGIDIPGDHIKDFLGGAALAGIRTLNNTPFKGYIKAGVLHSGYRERSVTDGFQQATSLLAEALGKYKNYGLKTVLHSGNGHKFAFGDPLYCIKNYMRTDVIWYFINHKNVKGTFNLSFHLIDWNDIDQQQQLSIIYVVGN